jgi:hypothetical protein
MRERPEEPTNWRQGQSDHIPLHRLWSFARLPGYPDAQSQAHLQECEECREAFQVCLRCDSFGVALKELGQDGATTPAPDGRPKLKTLFVVPGTRLPRR